MDKDNSRLFLDSDAERIDRNFKLVSISPASFSIRSELNRWLCTMYVDNISILVWNKNSKKPDLGVWFANSKTAVKDASVGSRDRVHVLSKLVSGHVTKVWPIPCKTFDRNDGWAIFVDECFARNIKHKMYITFSHLNPDWLWGRHNGSQALPYTSVGITISNRIKSTTHLDCINTRLVLSVWTRWHTHPSTFP